jgi:hypothetical protein
MSLPGSHNLTLYRGDSFRVGFRFEQDGSPRPMPTTGWLAQIRERHGSTTVLAEFTVDTSAAADGIVSIALTPAQTLLFSSGVWDLQHTDGAEVRTWMQGQIIVRADVTR